MDDIVNDKNSPSIMPQNEWTRMMDAVTARNRSGTSLTPDQIAAGTPITGAPLPAVRSADLGRATTPLVPVAPPLSQEQIDYLNQQALAAGVHPSQIPGYQPSEEDLGPYATMEAAIAAGAPVGSEPEAIAIGARKFREAVPVFAQPEVRMTAREVIAARQKNDVPRLPDFSLVQMIDMVNARVCVDGMFFDCSPAEMKMLRKFCVNKAKKQVMEMLDKALSALEVDGDDGGTTSV